MTDIRDRELKPCPFCGGVAWHGVPTDGEGGVYCDRYAAGCSHCGFRLDVIEKDETAPFHQTKQEAIDKWNTRNATQERKDAAIEAARTALTKCANEMGLPVSAFPFSEVFSEMFPGESIEEK
jgi:Lar family restriction alleviation protein